MPYRPPNGPEKYRDESWVRQKYWGDGLSQTEIAELCDCSKETIRRWMKRHEIDIRDKSDRVAKSWEGDSERRKRIGEVFAKSNTTRHPHLFVDNEGYVLAGSADGNGGSEQVRMHRLLATLKVDGISELDGMHVHHKNGVPWFNTLDNIEVLTPSEHSRLHRHVE